MKHYVQPEKLRDLSRQELIQRILNDEQKLAASRAKLEAERAAESTAKAAQAAANTSTAPQAASPVIETSRQNQPASDPIANSQISKETQQMSSTPVAQAKAALRAKASNDSSASEPVSLPVNSVPNASSDTPDLDHHSRKCQVCRHPHRETIEGLFVNWHSPRDISDEFDRLDWTSIYRHARATGLYAKRSRNLRAVFDLVLENASAVTPSAQGIVAVVRAYTALTENNTWTEPEKRVHIINHIFRHDVRDQSNAMPEGNVESERTSSTSAAQWSSSESGLPRVSSAANVSEPLCDSSVPQAAGDSETCSAPAPSTRHSFVTAPQTNAFQPRACAPQRAISPGHASKSNRNSPELKFPLSHT